MTGLPAAGKSTLAAAVKKELDHRAIACSVLDGDVMRRGLCRDLGFTLADRAENVRRVAEVAHILNDAGLTTVCALVSPIESQRAAARNIVGQDRWLCVYLSTPLEECERRDPKGMYRQARAGRLPQFTGVASEYEAPANADLTLDTARIPLHVCVARTIALLMPGSTAQAEA